MRDVAHVLKKQKQIIEIEIGQAKLNKRLGYQPIHPKEYYVKLALTMSMLNKSIKLLESTDEDIYENFQFLEQ